MFKMKSAVVAVFVTCLLASSPLPARSCEHQFDEPLHIFAPASPSGILDQAPTCLVTKSLSRTIRQTVIVESAPGAGGTISIQALLGAKLDGKTVIKRGLGPNAANYQPYPKRPYTAQDMAQASHVLSMSHVLALSPHLNVQAIADLEALARSKPSSLSVALSTTNSSNRLTSELFKSSAGVSAVNLGTALAFADLTRVGST